MSDFTSLSLDGVCGERVSAVLIHLFNPISSSKRAE